MRIKIGIFLILLSAVCASPALAENSESTLSQTEQERLLDPDNLAFTNPDLTNVDYERVRTRLLNMGASIRTYPTSKQTYYWYHLALSGYHLRLNSDRVIPALEKALSKSQSIPFEQQLNMRKQSVRMAMEYQQYEKVISYLDQTFALGNQHPELGMSEPQGEAKRLYAIAHYQLEHYEQAAYYLESLIDEVVKAGDKPSQKLLNRLVAAYSSNRDEEKEYKVRKQMVTLYPTRHNIHQLELMGKRIGLN